MGQDNSEIVYFNSMGADSKTCRKCGVTKPYFEFRKRFGNYISLCLLCARARSKAYTNAHKERVYLNKSKFYAAKKDQYARANRHNREKTIESFMSMLFHNLKQHTVPRKYPRKHVDNVCICRRPINVTIDINYLISLYHKQDGKCAISGVQLAHQSGRLNSMSIDRIDNSQGYISGNVQLVCQFVNLGKHTGTNDDTIKFINRLKNE